MRVSPAGQKEAAPHDVVEVSTRKQRKCEKGEAD